MTEAQRSRQSPLDAGRLYIGDNGRLTCASLRCAGSSAHFTGHDLSGQKLALMTRQDCAEWTEALGAPPSCETCGAEAQEATR